MKQMRIRQAKRTFFIFGVLATLTITVIGGYRIFCLPANPEGEEEFPGPGNMSTSQSLTGEKREALSASEIPDSLLKLAEENPEAMSFVEDYEKSHSQKERIHLEDDILSTKGIPLFIQWDKRWGYRKYGGDFLAVTGCGPTCLSMIRCGLGRDGKWNPYQVSKMAEKRGYYVEGQGSSWELMTSGAAELGLKAEEVVFDHAHIIQALQQGKPIICAMRPGDFTTTGHFIVLSEVTPTGQIVIRDPNSKQRSTQTWELERLMKQIKNLWCYSFLPHHS